MINVFCVVLLYLIPTPPLIYPLEVKILQFHRFYGRTCKVTYLGGHFVPVNAVLIFARQFWLPEIREGFGNTVSSCRILPLVMIMWR